MSLHTGLGYGAQSFKGNFKVSRLAQRSARGGGLLEGLWRERGGTFCKVQSGLNIPLPRSHTGVTGRQMIDRQMNRHPDRYTDLAGVSFPNFLKLRHGTDSCAKNLGRHRGFREWGLVFTLNLVNLMGWGEALALNYRSSHPSFTMNYILVQPRDSHLTFPSLVLLWQSRNKCSYLMTLANLKCYSTPVAVTVVLL